MSNSKTNPVMDQNIAEESKTEFINKNINMVPKNRMKYFQSLDIDAQVEKIQFYIDMKKMKVEAIEKNKMINKVKDLFEKRHGTVEDAKDCIRYFQEFINGAKEREIKMIDEEIAKLQRMKQSLED